MATLTVKDNGVRVANPALRARVNADQIRSKYDVLLGELGFNLLQRHPKMIIYVQGATINMSDSERLVVVWKEDPYVLSIQRGDFVKNLRIGGEYDLHDFVSGVLQSLRDVWVEGGKQR